MPDDEKLFKTLESSSYSIFYNNSENKLSSLIGTAKDSLKISRNLTGVLATVSSANFDETHLKIYNEQIQHVFSGHNIFELRLHWEKIFTYLYVSKSDDLFVKMFKDFYETIRRITHTQELELRKDTVDYFFNSVLFAVAPSPKHFNNVLIDKIKASDIELHQLIDTVDIELIRNANMFSSHLMTYPLLNYTTVSDEYKFINIELISSTDYLTQEINTKYRNFELDEKKLMHSPRFIHYHEIILFYHYIYLSTHEERFEEFYYTKPDEVLKDYNKFNNLADLSNTSFPEKYNEEKENLYIVSRQDDEDKDKLKVGIVSIKISLTDIESAYVTKPNLSYDRLQGIFDILNKSIDKKHKVDLLVFPEVSIPYSWVHLMARFAKKNNIGIIFGVEHIKIGNVVSNYTCVMLPFKTGEHVFFLKNIDPLF